MHWANKAIIYIKNIVSSNRGSRFRQNLLKIVKANIFAQVFTFVFTPILTRLYTPADYGTVAIFMSLLSMLSAFATWRFDWSIPNAVSRIQSVALLALGLITLLIISVSSFFVLWSFPESWTFWKGFQSLRPFLLLLPLALVGTGLHQLLQAWYIRENDLTAVSKTKFTQSISGTGLSVTGGIAALGATGLIISSVVSAWVGLSIMIRHAVGLPASILKLSFVDIKLAWIKFIHESTLSTSTSIVTMASIAAIPLLLTQYYSPTEIGWYTLMYRLASAPVGIFTEALGQSCWSEAAILVKTDISSLKRLYLRTTGRLAIFAFPIAAACLAGPLLVGPIWGHQWQSAGYILAALAPLVAAQIIVQPVTHLIVHRKQHWKLYLDACKFIFILLIIIVSAENALSLPLLILSLSVLTLVTYSILFYLNLKCLTK